MPDAGTWIALGVGAYGAGLSTFTAVAGRREIRRALRRGIQVSARTRILAEDLPRPVLAIHAFNSQRRPVEVIRAGVITANGIPVWHGPETPELPARLGDGESVEIRLPDDWLELVRASTQQDIVRLAVMDAAGTIYSSPRRESPEVEAQ